MRVLGLVLGVFVALPAFGGELMTVEPAVEYINKDAVQTAFTCDELGYEITRLERDLSQTLNNNIQFLDDIAYTMNDWHRTLRQYEGRSVEFRYGYFQPISNAAGIVRRDCGMFARQFQDSLDRLRQLELMANDCR